MNISENSQDNNPILSNENQTTQFTETIIENNEAPDLNEQPLGGGTRIFQSTECTNTKTETLAQNNLNSFDDNLNNIITALDPNFEQEIISPKDDQNKSIEEMHENIESANNHKVDTATQILEETTQDANQNPIEESISFKLSEDNLIQKSSTTDADLQEDQSPTQNETTNEIKEENSSEENDEHIAIINENENQSNNQETSIQINDIQTTKPSQKHNSKIIPKTKEPEHKNYEIHFKTFEEEMTKSPPKPLSKATKPKEAPLPMPKVNDITPSFYKRNNMFLTQIEEEAKIKKSTDPDFEPFEYDAKADRQQMLYDAYQSIQDPYMKKDQVKPAKRANSIMNMYKPKITYPYQQPSSSSLSQNKKQSSILKTDYSQYDDESFDWEEKQKKIPPKLREMIVHSPQSIVFRALCGENILNDAPKRVINSVIQDLKMYLKMCISKNLIGESSYADCIISNLKIDLNKTNSKKQKEEEKLEQRISKAENSFEERKQHWTEKKNILEVEFDIALEDLDLRNQEQISTLDDQWNSEKMQQKFNKPSAKLIELRQNAHALLVARQYEDAGFVAGQVEKLEEYETNEAAYQMQKQYQRAHEALANKFESNKKAMKESYETKLNGILASEASDLHHYEQRIDNLHKMRNNLQIEMKINAKNRKKEEEKKVPIVVKAPTLTPNAKLKLPPLRAVPTRKSNARPATYK